MSAAAVLKLFFHTLLLHKQLNEINNELKRWTSRMFGSDTAIDDSLYLQRNIFGLKRDGCRLELL